MADQILYELGRPGVIASPDGCAACGWPERGHPVWYVEAHIAPGVPQTYIRPDDPTRLARMKLRRKQRVVAAALNPPVAEDPAVGAAYDRVSRTPMPWSPEYSAMLERQDDADREATRPGAVTESMTLRDVQGAAWRNKVGKGFNTTDVPLEFCFLQAEVGEAFDAWRKGFPDLAEELADIALFLVALAEMNGVDLQAAVEAKLAKNAGRTYAAGPNGYMVRVDSAPYSPGGENRG